MTINNTLMLAKLIATIKVSESLATLTEKVLEILKMILKISKSIYQDVIKPSFMCFNQEVLTPAAQFFVDEVVTPLKRLMKEFFQAPPSLA